MRAEALGVAECVVINEADKAVELHQGILERRCRKQNLGRVCKRGLERPANAIVGAVDVPQAVRLVDDDQIPRDDHQFVGLPRGKLIRADDERLLLEGTAHAVFLQLVVVLSFKDDGRQEELFFDFLRPLLAQVGRRDDKHAPSPFRPFLRQRRARLRWSFRGRLRRQGSPLWTGAT